MRRYSVASTLGVFVYLFIGLFVVLPKVQAQENRSFTISPPSESVTLNPGATSLGNLKFINGSSETLSVSAKVQDFIVDDSQGTPDFLPQDTRGKPYAAASWMQVSPNTFTLAPHQTQVLEYVVHVPTNARPGGHYVGVLYMPGSPTGAENTGGTSVTTQLGTLFSLDITGPIREQALVSKFLSEHGFYEYGPVNTLTQIRNFGDLHIKPHGTITIYDILGRKLAVLPIESHNIFPQAARNYVNSFGQKWMIGPLTAQFTATYGRSGTLPLTASMTFWVFPWKVGVVVLLIIVALTLTYLVWRKTQREKIENNNNPNIPNPPNKPTA